MPVLKVRYLFTFGFQLFGGIEGVGGGTLLDELLCVLLIKSFGFALALAIGAVGAGVKGAFIGVEAAPGEAVENIFFCSYDITALVSVFDAENKVA